MMNMDIIVQFSTLWGIELADSKLKKDKYQKMQEYDSADRLVLFQKWLDEYLKDENVEDTVEFFHDKLEKLLAPELEMYVVKVRSGFIRDAQIFSADAQSENPMSDEQLTDEDIFDTSYECNWQDFEGTVMLGVYKAKSEPDACDKAAAENGLDVRILYGTSLSVHNVK